MVSVKFSCLNELLKKGVNTAEVKLRIYKAIPNVRYVYVKFLYNK